MQYLDAFEGLRSQGFPDEPLTTRRYEILHGCMDGISDPVSQRELTVVFATEAYLKDPPTVDSLRLHKNFRGDVTNSSLVTQEVMSLEFISSCRVNKYWPRWCTQLPFVDRPQPHLSARDVVGECLLKTQAGGAFCRKTSCS